ncbi:hypothetical protein D6777_02280 [Candidatus Woesearchaeota archaeon]|nr:MAG: hypothetical protein D6777_02280 [Candidatus Woesearchaeota archaeon]
MGIIKYISKKNLEKSKLNKTFEQLLIAERLSNRELYSPPEITRSPVTVNENLIAIDGLNCSGKSTQIRQFQSRYNNIIGIRDNSNSCWDILSKIGKGTYLVNDPISDTFLWQTYFKEQYEDNIKKFGINFVFFDRYKLSVMAIQKGIFAYNNILFNDDLFFKDLLSSLPDPKYKIYIDIPITDLIRRYEERGKRKDLTSYDLKLTEIIRKCFKDLAKSEGYLIIDGRLDEVSIFNRIKEHIMGEK